MLGNVRRVVWMSALFGLLALAACSGTSEYPLVGSARAAGADGTVQVEEVEGGNHLVTIQVAHLPPPERLGNGLTAYMVWFQAEDQQVTKAGNLAFDPDTRLGNAMATTPLKKFVVKVTAERDATVAAPSDIVVAQRRISVED